jgi:hypothetical protein
MTCAPMRRISAPTAASVAPSDREARVVSVSPFLGKPAPVAALSPAA